MVAIRKKKKKKSISSIVWTKGSSKIRPPWDEGVLIEISESLRLSPVGPLWHVESIVANLFLLP